MFSPLRRTKVILYKICWLGATINRKRRLERKETNYIFFTLVGEDKSVQWSFRESSLEALNEITSTAAMKDNGLEKTNVIRYEWLDWFNLYRRGSSTLLSKECSYTSCSMTQTSAGGLLDPFSTIYCSDEARAMNTHQEGRSVLSRSINLEDAATEGLHGVEEPMLSDKWSSWSYHYKSICVTVSSLGHRQTQH